MRHRASTGWWRASSASHRARLFGLVCELQDRRSERLAVAPLHDDAALMLANELGQLAFHEAVELVARLHLLDLQAFEEGAKRVGHLFDLGEVREILQAGDDR